MKEHIFIAVLLLLVPNLLSGQAIQQLHPSTQKEAAAFGFHLAHSEEWLLVGAKEDTIDNIACGTAYFYKNFNGSWLEWQKVSPDIPGDGDLFGISVDIDKTYAVIGANGDDDQSLNSGAAYIYQLVDDHWVFSQKLLPEETGIGSSEMGIAVSLKNNVLVVGAYSDMTNGPFAGAAYIYELNGQSWELSSKISSQDCSSDDKFGRSVHTDGSRVIICGVLNDDDGTNSGSAYIFSKEEDEWVENAKLTAPDAFENDRFGRSVAINRDYVAVGSVLDDDNGSQSGSVYIFREYFDGWRFETKITPSDGQADDFFGYSLAMQNPYLVVGAHNDDDFGLNSGAAYLFKRQGNHWQELWKIYASSPAVEANFGESVDINEDFISIGAPYDWQEVRSTGAAYVMPSPMITEISFEPEVDFQIYPNPASGYVKIVWPADRAVSKITLIDHTGRTVLLQKLKAFSATLDLKNVSAGVYLVNIEFTNGINQAARLIKQ